MSSIRGKPAAALFVVSLAVFVDLLVYGMMVPVLPGYASGLGASQSILLERRKAEVQLRRTPFGRSSREPSRGSLTGGGPLVVARQQRRARHSHPAQGGVPQTHYPIPPLERETNYAHRQSQQ